MTIINKGRGTEGGFPLAKCGWGEVTVSYCRFSGHLVWRLAGNNMKRCACILKKNKKK